MRRLHKNPPGRKDRRAHESAEELSSKRLIPLAAAGAIVASTASIAVSYILLVAGLLLSILDAVRRGRINLKLPPYAWILGLFSLAFVLSALFSDDVSHSLRSLKRLLRFAYVPLVFSWLGRSQVEGTLRWIHVFVIASAGYGVLQYFWLLDVDLLNRITGFMSHWMTFSGQLMFVALSLAGYLCWRGGFLARTSHPLAGKATGADQAMAPAVGKWSLFFWIGGLALILWTLVLTMTRSAWIGVVVGGLVLLTFIRWKWVLIGLAALMVVLLILPQPFRDRLESGLDVTDTTTRIRGELLQTGARMMRANPWFGVGPGLLSHSSLGYRSHEEFPDWAYQHLHNNLFQIGAELGLLTLAVWLALWLSITRSLIRLYRQSSDEFCRYLTLNGAVAVIAFQVAGLFEYNFGDAEIVILLLFFVTAPYAIQAQARPSS